MGQIAVRHAEVVEVVFGGLFVMVVVDLSVVMVDDFWWMDVTFAAVETSVLLAVSLAGGMYSLEPVLSRRCSC